MIRESYGGDYDCPQQCEGDNVMSDIENIAGSCESQAGIP